MNEINTFNCLPAIVKNQVQGCDSQIKENAAFLLGEGEAPIYVTKEKEHKSTSPLFPLCSLPPFSFCILLKCLPMENWGGKTPKLSRSNHGLMEWGSGPQTNGRKADDRLVEENKGGWERKRKRVKEKPPTCIMCLNWMISFIPFNPSQDNYIADCYIFFTHLRHCACPSRLWISTVWWNNNTHPCD